MDEKTNMNDTLLFRKANVKSVYLFIKFTTLPARGGAKYSHFLKALLRKKGSLVYAVRVIRVKSSFLKQDGPMGWFLPRRVDGVNVLCIHIYCLQSSTPCHSCVKQLHEKQMLG